jgi:hypothetical protein
MKNKNYIIGLIAAMLIITGGLFKVMHWPGSGIVLVLGIFLLCAIFLPTALWSAYIDWGKRWPLFFIVIFLTVLFDFVGGLFKIMHWPGANIMMIVGIGFPIVVFLPVYLYYQRKEEYRSQGNFLYVMFLLVYLSVMSSLLALNVSKEFIDGTMKMDQMANLEKYHDIKNKRGQKGAHQELTYLKNQTNELLAEINALKIKLILFENEENKKAINPDNTIDVFKITNKDSKTSGDAIMQGMGFGHKLRDKAKAYETLIANLSHDMKIPTTYISAVYYTLPHNDELSIEPLSWKEYHYKGLPLVLVLHNLTILQNNIILAEQGILSNTKKTPL